MRRTSFLVASLLALSSSRPLLAQCALCAESLAGGKKAGGGNPAAGFHFGILFLLGTVAVLAAGLVAVFFLAARGAPAVEPDAAVLVNSVER